MVTSPILMSIQVGLPRLVGVEDAEQPMDQPWTTGFYKEPVTGPVQLGTTNLAGDGQADLRHHGGPDKAVLAYSADHYAYWCATLNMASLPYGAFGENFTIAGLSEPEVCIGDTWRVGEHVTVQVSQPRQPCWKLARRWRVKSLARQVERTGYSGWYFRVLTPGDVKAGLPLALIERPFPAWTVERANRLMHHDKKNHELAAELAALPPLSVSWRKTLAQRASRNAEPDPSQRLIGENG